MLVAEKKHHIETHIYGRGADYLIEIIRKTLPDIEVTYEDSGSDDDYIDSEHSDWYYNMKSQMTSGINLRIRRENKGLSKTELSKKTGIAVPNISLMESDKRCIGIRTARKLASALDCRYTDFIL